MPPSRRSRTFTFSPTRHLAPPAGAILSEHAGDEFNASMSSFGVGSVVPEDEDDAWYNRRDGRRVLARHMEADDAEWYQKKDDDKWRFKKGEDTWYMNKGDETWHLQETDDDAAHEEDGQRRRAREEDGRRRGAHGGCDDAEHMHMKDEKGDDTGHWKCDDTGRHHGRSGADEEMSIAQIMDARREAALQNRIGDALLEHVGSAKRRKLLRWRWMIRIG